MASASGDTLWTASANADKDSGTVAKSDVASVTKMARIPSPPSLGLMRRVTKSVNGASPVGAFWRITACCAAGAASEIWRVVGLTKRF